MGGLGFEQLILLVRGWRKALDFVAAMSRTLINSFPCALSPSALGPKASRILHSEILYYYVQILSPISRQGAPLRSVAVQSQTAW